MKELLAMIAAAGAIVRLVNQVERLRPRDRSPLPRPEQKLRCARCNRIASRRCTDPSCNADLCGRCSCPRCRQWAQTVKAQPQDGPATWSRSAQMSALRELHRDLAGTRDAAQRSAITEQIRVLNRCLKG